MIKTCIERNNRPCKLQSCLPGTVVKFENDVFGYLLGSSEETPGKLLVLFPSGARSEMDKTTMVKSILGPDEARLTLLRILGLIEEI